jgi:flagellar protein FliT
MSTIEQFLQKSAQLYKLLVDSQNDLDHRTENIERINLLLNERGKVVEKLKEEQFKYDASNKMHATLKELDNGIHEKLNVIMDTIKSDLTDLQKSKQKEMQYIDPYSELRGLNSRYYDGKK